MLGVLHDVTDVTSSFPLSYRCKLGDQPFWLDRTGSLSDKLSKKRRPTAEVGGSYLGALRES
jgi:hypothetical protein